MNQKNQEIKCNVESCKFQNKNYCTLNKIEVTNCESDKATEKKETACNSFEFDKK